MTGVEVILAALAAGAGAGTSDVAGNAIRDAYTALRDAVRRRLGRRAAPGETDPTETELVAAGADRDEEILAAARHVLALADPDGTRAGRYAVDLRGATGVQVGDGTVALRDNYGAAGVFHGPVQIGVPPPHPPAPPGAE
jgi:hypothetical protein